MTGSVMAVVSGGARLFLERLAANEAARSLAAQESVHRIKNLLAVVQALYRRAASGSETVSEFRERFDSKLAALTIAQDMLVQRDWHDAPVDQLVANALAPFLIRSKICVAGGPAVVLPREHVSGLTMALYELATNALKYGALAAEGAVTVSWACDTTQCELLWVEKGGIPQTATSNENGFRHKLIKGALGSKPGTSVSYVLQPGEVVCRFSWPVGRQA